MDAGQGIRVAAAVLSSSTPHRSVNLTNTGSFVCLHIDNTEGGILRWRVFECVCSNCGFEMATGACHHLDLSVYFRGQYFRCHTFENHW